MELNLSLSSDELDRDDLQDLTRDLCRALSGEVGVEAQLPTEAPSPGSKSAADLPVWGQIAITAIGSGGAVVALIGVLKAYVQRGKALKIKLQKKNGDKIEIDGKNLGADQFDRIVETFLQDATK